MLGTEPNEEEFPIELDSLLEETRVAVIIHRTLKEEWAGVSGVYLGKSLQGIDTLFSIYEVNTSTYKKYVLYIINYIDHILYQDIEKRRKSGAPSSQEI